MKLSLSIHRSSWVIRIFLLLLCISIPVIITGNLSHVLQHHWISTLAITLTFILSSLTLTNLHYLPYYQTAIRSTSTVFVWLSVIVLFIIIFHLPYSRSYLITGGIVVLVSVLLGNYLNHQRNYHIGYIPSNDQYDLRNFISEQYLTIIETPELPKNSIKYLVVDLDRMNLSKEWLRFISSCSLSNITVINAKQLLESYTGKVTIEHLNENELVTIQPSLLYSHLKRWADTLVIILSLPVVLPILLLTMMIIRLESKGPVIFTQNRVGYRGREFKMYKLRSMYLDSEAEGAQFAALEDLRITPVGKIIRKFRIDELPQFLNIIKGEMSLIGPRPEQKTFVDQFEQEIPFYNYRNIVKPGISGWAQVNQGYASGTEETFIKTEYDLFYIKYFSFSLDCLIFLKTIKTILGGFGAR